MFCLATSGCPVLREPLFSYVNMSSICCAVRGCHNNWKKKNLSLSQHCFEHGKMKSECCGPAFNLHPPPSKDEDLRCWLKALNLKHPPKRPYVCSFHFVEKKPTKLHPYPEKWLGYTATLKKPRGVLVRQVDASTISAVAKDTATQCHKEVIPGPPPDHNYTLASPLLDRPLQCHRATQCSGPAELHKELLRTDHLSLLYTGLSMQEFAFLADQLLKDYVNTFHLDACDQVLMTLMKLRLNLLQADLAERFHVSQSQVSKIMSVWFDIMEEKMRRFIPWLPRETILATMPQCFREHYPTTTCVIDCAETPIQKPHNLDSSGESYSHYYGQNTIKYLLAIAPCGVIMFVSAAYRGKCSDKFITSDSGFLEYLHPGDVVMADRGFLISDLLHERQVQLVIPAFTKESLQLSEEDTTHTRPTANVRVHVERVIRCLKNFRILSQTIPINLVHKCDKILRICAALSNLRGDIIPEDEKDC
uniref:THAP-type domain-containing protein n=1 Tax=Neogobius melanostomus TaxID=47308 RepID=A0A8C6TLY5_9GOBI